MRKLILLLLLLLQLPHLMLNGKFFAFKPFNKIRLYYESSQPAHVTLSASGDGGWNMGAMEMARELGWSILWLLALTSTFLKRSVEDGI